MLYDNKKYVFQRLIRQHKTMFFKIKPFIIIYLTEYKIFSSNNLLAIVISCTIETNHYQHCVQQTISIKITVLTILHFKCHNTPSQFGRLKFHNSLMSFAVLPFLPQHSLCLRLTTFNFIISPPLLPAMFDYEFHISICKCILCVLCIYLCGLQLLGRRFLSFDEHCIFFCFGIS